MRTLSIGNSFSTDALRWLHDLSVAGGQPIETVNLHIGGCSLMQHALNARNNTPNYLLEVNGELVREGVTMQETLEDGEYDVVTLQQASPSSGLLTSYTPYADELADLVRQVQPKARLYVHQTWAYDEDSEHELFIAYNRKQQMMYDKLSQAYDIMAMALDASIIPTGDLIQELRESPYFAKDGAVPCSYDVDEELSEFPAESEDTSTPPSLTRDGFHLNLYYGRYAAACVWYAALTGSASADVDWIPPKPVQLPKNQDLGQEVWAFIRETADRIARENTTYKSEQIGDVPDIGAIPGANLPDNLR